MSKNCEAKDEEKKRARQAFIREREERDRMQTEGRRRLCTFLKFPRFCGDARCKRARRCAGDANACFIRFWPQVPVDLRDELLHAMKLIAEGMPPAEAAREARAYVAQRRRIDAEMARRATRTVAHVAPEPEAAPAAARTCAPPPPAGPRIRML